MRTSKFIAEMFKLVHEATNGRITSVDHMNRIASDMWMNLNTESAFSTPAESARDFVTVLNTYHYR